MDEEIDSILDDARNALGPYCMTECNAYCCKKEAISLTDEEAKLFKGSTQLVEKEDFQILIANPCPKLKDNKCTIYQRRPSSCREFPIFKKENEIFLANMCPGIINKKIFLQTKKLVAFGYKFKTDFLLIKD
jgi:Fe-S-cluster containining protein